MSEQADRPSTLRRTPRPAPDERVDPVDYRPEPRRIQPAETAPATPTQPAEPGVVRRGRPRRELTAQFSTRLTPDVIALIDRAAADQQTTIRDVVEQAIRRTWS